MRRSMEVYNANPMKMLQMEDMITDALVYVRAKSVQSCEDEKTSYLEMPDGLRLIFREGEHAGWYLPGEGGGDDATN